ncbi:hypothetical protein CR513_52237, partial [Mucuna pruriens]
MVMHMALHILARRIVYIRYIVDTLVVNTNKMLSLNDTNYHLWEGEMEDLLFVKKMHLLVFVTQNL